MNIVAKVNQAEALRRGIDASSSTAKINVNPAQLTQAQRDALAARLKEGFELISVSIPEPSYNGLIEELDKIVAKEEKRRENANRAAMEEIKRLESEETQAYTVNVGRDGRETYYESLGVAKCDILIPDNRFFGTHVDADDDVKQELNELHKAVNAERRARIAEAVESLQKDVAKFNAECEELAAEAEDAARELLERLPEDLAARYEMGFAEDREIADAIKEIVHGDIVENYPQLEHLPLDRENELTGRKPRSIDQKTFNALKCVYDEIKDGDIADIVEVVQEDDEAFVCYAVEVTVEFGEHYRGDIPLPESVTAYFVAPTK